MKKVGMTLAAIAATFFCLSEVFADCSASNQCFSQTPEDYSIVLSKEQNSDGYQVILYGRLAKNVDFASLSTFDSAWKGSEANFPHKESGLATLSGQRILPIMTLVLLQTGGSTTSKSFPLYSDCQLLHPKSAAAETSDKGEVFRCVSNQKLDESMLDGTDPLALSDPGTMCNIRTYDGTLKSSTPAIVTAKLISQFGKDADNDKVPDAIDNCPDVANFSQEANDDGTGIACPVGAGTSSVQGSASGDADTATSPRAFDEGGACALIPATSVDLSGIVMLVAALMPIIIRRKA